MNELPDSMVNGADQNYNKKEAQTWERPWTLEEIRQTSLNWSLGADSGLFLCLQDFSQRMLSKTHDIEKQLDGLIRETKTAECCLHTVFNDFLMLSNTQFIENRVYDEEVEDPVLKTGILENPPEQEKTREQKEVELIPKMQEAVNYGLNILDSAFEQLDIKAGNSDSEDEEVTDRVEQILEPKDLYVDRPLPHLIGSQLFMEHDDVGLGDLSSEEMTIDSDRDSVLDSEDGKDADQFDEDLSQDEEMQSSIKKKLSMGSSEDDEDDEDGDSDIFGESDKYDDDEDRVKTDPSFAEELASRIKSEQVSKPEKDRTLEENNDNELFQSPKMKDEDFTLFGGKKGLFSGGRGLFDDDEGDLFSDAPKLPTHEETPEISSQTSAGLIQSKSRKNLSLFRDDEDDDKNLDLFGEKEIVVPAAVINEEVTEEQVQVPEKKMPAGAISMFGPGTKNLLTECLRKKHPAINDMSEKSEEILPTIPKGQSKPEPETLRKQSKVALSLFDDDEGEEEDLFAAKSKASPSLFNKTASSSLFSDDEDQWIDPKPFLGKPTKNIEGVTTSQSAPSGLPFVKATHQESLFDEDDVDDELFAASKIVSQKHQRVDLLFEDDENKDDDSLFGFQPAVSNRGNTLAPVIKAPALDPSLFETDRREELAAPQPSKPSTTAEDKPAEEKPTEQGKLRPSEESLNTKSTGVFQEEELLFGHIQQKANNPGVDLFAPSKTADSTKVRHKPNLVVKPAAPLPEAYSHKIPGAVSVFPKQSLGSLLAPVPYPDPESVADILGIQPAIEEGINFDRPAQVTTLHSASKGRAKGSERRRPQTRAARLQLAQNSMEQREAEEVTQDEKPATNTPHSFTSPDQTSLNIVPFPTLPSPEPFGSDDVFGYSVSSASKQYTSSKSKTNFKTTVDNFSGPALMPKREQEIQTTPSLFEEHEGDIFKRVKPRVEKEAGALSLEEEDDKEEFFALGKNSLAAVFTKDSMTSSSFSKEDNLQEKVSDVHKGSKNQTEKSSLDPSLLEVNVDIFADLMTTSKPKSKKKMETKSIFDDDMDDIFSSSSVKLGTSTTQKPKKKRSSQDGSEAEDSCSNIFNDPLNALGGN